MKPTPQQIRERNEAWARALEANPKKCVGQMRDSQGGRCCLAVAQDVALELGMTWPVNGDGYKKPEDWLNPWPETSDFFGWGNVSGASCILQGQNAAAWNDGTEYIDELSHAEIAKLDRQAFCKEGAE